VAETSLHKKPIDRLKENTNLLLKVGGAHKKKQFLGKIVF